MDNTADVTKLLKRHTVTPEIFDDIKKSVLRDVFFHNSQLSSADKPVLIALGGQPGSGKTSLANISVQELNNNAVYISADDFREKHPDFKKIIESYPDKMPELTAPFANKMADELLAFAAKNNINVVVEGTMGNSKVVENTIDQFKNLGYSIELRVRLYRKKFRFYPLIYARKWR